ncbi:sigma factor-like helix-turn-helix DNA-binding protein [Cohnella zeiphila]|uniref:RNA polymerase sigma factor 70 region 4 type 2 domain-containing protein n=1 Tax=Cohnella zeiphila TaxID=2761120 RepID=A0A7X0SJP3_9BACL|nr:sigma factor-like helix-turn-helix DNA-binding protein [Cohnella zeiphila]MBB6730049.1 hypothetical protein [Cohnella zeiphila]
MNIQENRVRVTDLGPATLETYEETRRELLRAADRLTRRIRQMEPVRTMEEMNELLEADRERKLLMEMISSCSYIIEWLATGRRPGNRRGIERRASYQREIPTDPARLPTAVWFDQEDEQEAGDAEMKHFRLEAALRGLTARERDCYVLAHGQGCSFSEIAGMLHVSKSSVGTYMARAQRKISHNIGHVVIMRVG